MFGRTVTVTPILRLRTGDPPGPLIVSNGSVAVKRQHLSQEQQCRRQRQPFQRNLLTISVYPRTTMLSPASAIPAQSTDYINLRTFRATPHLLRIDLNLSAKSKPVLDW